MRGEEGRGGEQRGEEGGTAAPGATTLPVGHAQARRSVRRRFVCFRDIRARTNGVSDAFAANEPLGRTSRFPRCHIGH